jgi:magnesium-protoporphyrin O-methyltransferase
VSNTAHLKQQLRHYFDGVGFERWTAIYGEQAKLSRVRQSIRDGHQAMLRNADAWLVQRFGASAAGRRALDAGCGTGLFTRELAGRDFQVTAVDIAPQMVLATRERLQQAGLQEQADLLVADLEQVGGSYDLVLSFDVLIHYPHESFAPLCRHLAGLCTDTLLITYAPYNSFLAAMHRVGGFFPRSDRRTEIQMIPDSFVDATLAEAGMQVCRRRSISVGFYHVQLLEARKG